MQITKARAVDFKPLSKLLFLSGPDNLLSLLTGHRSGLTSDQKQSICLAFLESALQLPEGQFGFKNQTILLQNGALCGCVSYWQTPIPDLFKQQTLRSLVTHFGTLETAAILNNSEGLSHLVQPPSPNELSIGHLAVEPSFRRQGLATHLLVHCLDVARKLGKSKLILDVMEDNHEAYQTYVKFGFKQKFISEPTEEARNAGFLSHIHMQKSVM